MLFPTFAFTAGLAPGAGLPVPLPPNDMDHKSSKLADEAGLVAGGETAGEVALRGAAEPNGTGDMTWGEATAVDVAGVIMLNEPELPP